MVLMFCMLVIFNQDSELFMLGGESHKKKKKHSDDYYYRGEFSFNIKKIYCHVFFFNVLIVFPFSPPPS